MPKNVVAAPSTVSARMLRSFRTYDNPPRNSSIIRCVRAAGRCLMCSDINATMTTRNESALRLKQALRAVISGTSQRLNAASVAPASSGPIIRATLNWIELSAMALVRSCLPTSDGISD